MILLITDNEILKVDASLMSLWYEIQFMRAWTESIACKAEMKVFSGVFLNTKKPLDTWRALE